MSWWRAIAVFYLVLTGFAALGGLMALSVWLDAWWVFSGPLLLVSAGGFACGALRS